jgi:NhaA family Na+:H+ antiporter
VLPLFALSNVRIHFAPELFAGLASPLALGVIAGLAIGKPLGFLGFASLASRLGWAERPEGVSWPMVAAIGALAGIGFTISLFIAQLAFGDGEARELASLAILVASVVSGAIGYAILTRITRGSRR